VGCGVRFLCLFRWVMNSCVRVSVLLYNRCFRGWDFRTWKERETLVPLFCQCLSDIGDWV